MTASNSSCFTCKTRGCSLLSNCSDKVLQEISDKKFIKQVKKGDKIFCEGKEVLNIAFVKSGVVKVEINGKKNRPLIMRLAREGDIFGHRIIDSTNQYPVSIVAVENSQVCLLPAHHFRQLMDQNADFRKEIIKTYLQEMKNTEIRAVHLVHKSVREKVACVLLHIAEVYKYDTASNGIYIHLSRQDLADLTASTKEQVSKALNQFKLEKIIAFKAKRFRFLDIRKLESIASFCEPT